jgi:hypothetical protein
MNNGCNKDARSVRDVVMTGFDAIGHPCLFKKMDLDLKGVPYSDTVGDRTLLERNVWYSSSVSRRA